jgi:putative ABC transport system permease protein
LEELLQDIRFGLRGLAKSPLITLAAIMSLALGIGANASIFSAVDVFLIRPLPYPDSEDLVRVYMANRDRGWSRSSISPLDFLDYREQSSGLELATYQNTGLNLSGGDRPERLGAIVVSPGLLSVFGVQPAVGRGFLPEEERDGAGQVVMISDGLWQDRFGGDPEVLGSTIQLNGNPYTVVGVLPPRFTFLEEEPDVWLPWQLTGEESRGSHYLRVVGRLREGATLESARSELIQIAARLEAEFPDTNAGKTVEVLDLRDSVFDEGFVQGSLISSAAVLFVLLIACANVANLLLARGAGRQRELALRAALGAGRLRLVRQLLTESLVLAVAGGLTGLLVAVFGIRWLVSMMPAFFPQRELVALDARVLLFMGGVTLLSGVLFGLAPAFQTTAMNLRNALSEGGRSGSDGGKGGRLRRWLVISEITLSVVLLVSAAVLIRSYMAMEDVELGYRLENVLTARVSLPETKYPDEVTLHGFWREAEARLEAIPGVERVGATTMLPTWGSTSTFYSIPTEDAPPPGQRPTVAYKHITPGYADVMDLPLVRGRHLSDEDRMETVRVGVINERFAQRHWEGADPIGQLVDLGQEGDPIEIVGVVGDTREWGPDSEPFPIIYQPVAQSGYRAMALVLRTSGDPYQVVDEVREAILAMDPDQPVYQVFSMEDVMQEEMGGNLVMVKILGVLGVIAFLLAVVGVYGVMAYSVSRRTQEMGIRMALGADHGDVLSLVVRQGAAVAGTGVALGLLISLGATRGLSFFLFGADPFDPVAFLTVGAVLLASGVLASYFPARRATRVDPVIAFRAQ